MLNITFCSPQAFYLLCLGSKDRAQCPWFVAPRWAAAPGTEAQGPPEGVPCKPGDQSFCMEVLWKPLGQRWIFHSHAGGELVQKRKILKGKMTLESAGLGSLCLMVKGNIRGGGGGPIGLLMITAHSDPRLCPLERLLSLQWNNTWLHKLQEGPLSSGKFSSLQRLFPLLSKRTAHHQLGSCPMRKPLLMNPVRKWFVSVFAFAYGVYLKNIFSLPG